MGHSGKRRVLLHVCCAPCAGACTERLSGEYRVALYFYNPNIAPEEEYRAREEEVRRWAAEQGLELIVGEYRAREWRERVAGHEEDPERGERCRICFQERLEETARLAAERGDEAFTTTLTISPHKVVTMVFEAGRAAAEKHGVEFLALDFKKQRGFERSLEISREHGFYRQDYCGCLFSRREAEERRRTRGRKR